MIDKKLGHYEVLELIGAGGMGEVYRARDTRLGRDVAIKVIPPRLLGDEEHRARFEREARLLASLNHPHIASIYGLEHHEGEFFLVLEFVTGPDLADRLSRGPLPMEEALRVARQVAEALDSAHRQGVIHRDLKPSNIALTADGTVKVLDFGLAKALDPGAPGGSGSVSQSPTLMGGATRSHVILGTAAYMSPEQARGNPVDARADVWAFGCVVLECVTGKRVFDGESISDTLAAVLRDPIDWSALPADTPPSLKRLLRRAMERDPARRLSGLGDAPLDLDDAAEELRSGAVEPGPTAAPPSRRRLGGWLPWALAAGAGAAVIALALRGTPPPPPMPVARFTIPVDSLETSGLCPPIISPDGRNIVYSASGQLWVRALDDLKPRPLEGTEGAHSAFWSPDGASVGFQIGRRLWKAPIGGGHPVTICETAEKLEDVGRANWGEDGRIVFASGNGAIYAVSASGGTPVSLLDPGPTQESDFHSPMLLPGGRGVIFIPHPLVGARSKLDILQDGKRRRLWEHPGDIPIEYPAYDSGFLLFHRELPHPGIWAVPVSLGRLMVDGDPILVADGGDVPTVSRDGTLVYAGGSPQGHRLVRVSRTGAIDGEPVDRDRHIDDTAVSPSGKRLLEAILEGSDHSVVVRDLARGTRTVVPVKGVINPFWITESTLGLVRPDSTALVAYDLDRGTESQVLFRADGRGVFQRTALSPAVTRDGRFLLFVLKSPTTRFDVWILPLDGSGEGRPLIATSAQEEDPQPSPVDPLLAYISDASGRNEVYLSELDARGSLGARRWQVSSEGGGEPRWSLDGRHLYYPSGGRFMEVDIAPGEEVVLSPPRPLFDLGPQDLELGHGYAVESDSPTFLMIQAGSPGATHREIVVVQHWAEEFRKR